MIESGIPSNTTNSWMYKEEANWMGKTGSVFPCKACKYVYSFTHEDERRKEGRKVPHIVAEVDN